MSLSEIKALISARWKQHPFRLFHPWWEVFDAPVRRGHESWEGVSRVEQDVDQVEKKD